MNMKRALLLILIILFAAQAHAQTILTPQAQPQQQPLNGAIDPKVMQRCRSFSECTLVWGGCADAAVNKRYVDQYKPDPACTGSKQHDPKAVPTCDEGLCVAVVPDQQK